jgi:hypothetical protein
MTFKTKTIKGERYMICRASDPLDKYHKGHACDMWCKVGKNATAILCYKCTMSMTEPPEYNAGYRSKGFPRGWQFMSEFVHTDGTVYIKGVEQPDLKGTKEPTQVNTNAKPKLSKREKEELKDQLLQQLVFVRGQLVNSKLKKDINSNRSQLKKIERQLKKLN